MSETKARNLNTDALAYMGDALYELRVRERLLASGMTRVERLHQAATRYVSAPAQAQAIRRLFDDLTESEQAQVRRWRNHKYHTKAKNADPMTYKWATAFEALVGFLYLTGDAQRLAWLLERAMEITEEEHEDVIR